MFKLNRKTKYEVRLIQNNSLLQGKLDKLSDENKQLKLKSDDSISSQINIQSLLEKNNQIKTQLDIISQKNIVLSQQNLTFKSRLDQHSLVKRINKAEIKKSPRLHTDTIFKIISYENNTK